MGRSCAPNDSQNDVLLNFTSAGSKLKALSLRGNALEDAEAIALAETIEENTVLSSLNLFDNKITDAG